MKGALDTGNYFYISDRMYLVALFSVAQERGSLNSLFALPSSPPRFLITLVMPTGQVGSFPETSKSAVRDETNPALLPGISPTRPYGAREIWVCSHVSRTK